MRASRPNTVLAHFWVFRDAGGGGECLKIFRTFDMKRWQSLKRVCQAPVTHLWFRDIHDAYADVGAPLGDYGHRGPADISGTHAANVVLEVLGGHGFS